MSSSDFIVGEIVRITRDHPYAGLVGRIVPDGESDPAIRWVQLLANGHTFRVTVDRLESAHKPDVNITPTEETGGFAWEVFVTEGGERRMEGFGWTTDERAARRAAQAVSGRYKERLGYEDEPGAARA